jgi:hypothetical protein
MLKRCKPLPSLLQHIELNSVIGAPAETEAEQTTSTARDKSLWVIVATVKSLRRARLIAIEISKCSSSFVTSGHSSRLDSGILRRTCSQDDLAFVGTHASPAHILGVHQQMTLLARTLITAAGLRRSSVAVFVIEASVGIRPVMRTRRGTVLSGCPNISVPCQVVAGDLKTRVI